MSRIPQPPRDAPASEWTVYADALQEANDPRGELIALNLAVAKGMSTADRDAYLAKHKDALFGPLAAHFDAVSVTWGSGLPDVVTLRVKVEPETVMTAFLASPLAAARGLELVGTPSGRETIDLTSSVGKLLEAWPAELRSLALVDELATKVTMLASRDFDPPENLVRFGPLGGLWAHPLEALRLEVADSHQLDLGEIDAPELRSFTLRCLRFGQSYGGDSPISARLAAAKWPKLTSFELRIPEEFVANIIADEDAYISFYAGNEDYEDRADEAEIDGENIEGANWGQLAPVLENLEQTPLERLALTSFDTAGSLLDTLAQTGLPKTLVELDLSDSSVNSTEWFLAQNAMLAKLKRLVLTKTAISDDDVKALAKLGPEIVHSHAGGPTYRYVVGSE